MMTEERDVHPSKADSAMADIKSDKMTRPVTSGVISQGGGVEGGAKGGAKGGGVEGGVGGVEGEVKGGVEGGVEGGEEQIASGLVEEGQTSSGLPPYSATAFGSKRQHPGGKTSCARECHTSARPIVATDTMTYRCIHY